MIASDVRLLGPVSRAQPPLEVVADGRPDTVVTSSTLGQAMEDQAHAPGEIISIVRGKASVLDRQVGNFTPVPLGILDRGDRRGSSPLGRAVPALAYQSRAPNDLVCVGSRTHVLCRGLPAPPQAALHDVTNLVFPNDGWTMQRPAEHSVLD